MDKKKKIDFDPYIFLDIAYDADEKAIVKGYRKQALKWHPDKNPDNKEYAETMFLKVSLALEVLSDKAAKAAVDRLRSAKQAVKARNDKMDVKRQKLKEDLERREAGAFQKTQKEEEEYAQRMFDREVARLRKHGSTLLERERERLERQVHEQTPSASSRVATPPTDGKSRRLIVKWKVTADCDYDKTQLMRVFDKYGDVSACIISPKKPGRALVEMAEFSSAEHAVDIEKGTEKCPLSVTFAKSTDATEPEIVREKSPQWFKEEDKIDPSSADYESSVLMRMMQSAGKRKQDDTVVLD